MHVRIVGGESGGAGAPGVSFYRFHHTCTRQMMSGNS